MDALGSTAKPTEHFSTISFAIFFEFILYLCNFEASFKQFVVNFLILVMRETPNRDLGSSY